MDNENIQPQNLGIFQTGSLEKRSKEEKNPESHHYTNLFSLREKDIQWRIENRKVYGALLLGLLLLQNIVVFGLVITASTNGTLKDLQLVLGIITASTLAETIASVNIIVKWLFNDIDYTKK